MKKLILILLTLFSAVFGYAQSVGDTFIVDYITYKVTSLTPKTVETLDYDMAGGTVVTIPNAVTDTSVNPNVTYSVTTIGNFAFQNNNLTNATIPNSVTAIGDNAFLANLQLTCIVSEATIPPVIFTGGSTDSFGASYRSNIDLSIPTGTASAYATAEWTGFKSVAVGLTGTFIVDYITYQINPSPYNEVTITAYNVSGGTVVNIPATVNSGCREYSIVSIGDNAFLNSGITSVTIPNSVLAIGVAAFLGTDLQTVIIPDSVLTIGDGAFAQNYNLDNVVIGNNVTSIGDAAFRYASFSSITIPDSVTIIGLLVFGDTLSLTDVFSESIIPPTITTGGVTDTFTNAITRSNIHLHIPANTMGAYVTDTGALWTGFNPVTEDATLSTSNYELASDIKVFNTSEQLNVISSGTIQLENYTIYSISGAKIKVGTESTIAINNLPKGIYIIELSFDAGRLVKKFVK